MFDLWMLDKNQQRNQYKNFLTNTFLQHSFQAM
jgi:hypothetical protein